MTTTIEAPKTAQSLLDQFNKAEGKQNYKGDTYYPDRHRLESELRRVLEQEQNNWKQGRYSYRTLEPTEIEEAKNLIALYKQVFDWDTQYSVEVEYSLSSSTMNYSFDIDSKEELKDYLNGKKEIEEPGSEDSCWSNIDYGHDIESEDEVRAGVEVNNLRIKDKVNNYSVVLYIESENDKEYIENTVLKQFVEAKDQGTEYWITSGEVVGPN